MDVRDIPLAELLPPIYPVRRVADDEQMSELAASIATVGLLHPLVVVSEDSGYRILAGHRRFIALRALGWETVPCNVVDLEHRARADVTISENIVREEVNAVDLGWYLRHRMENEGLTQAEIGLRLGHSREWVTGYVRLTQLPDQVQLAVQEGKIAGRAALELERIKNQDAKEVYTRHAIAGGHSVQRVTQDVDHYMQNEKTIDTAIEVSQEVRASFSQEPDPLRCLYCGNPAQQVSGDMVWLCRPCVESLLKARGAGQSGST